MSLEREQRAFLEAVLAAEKPTDARLAIYHRNARATRGGALAAAYPVVQRLVGEAFFDEAAARYGEAHPSSSGNLDAYGARFAAFLERYPHARDLPYLPDVARLEWAVHECAHAPRGQALDYAALGAVPAGRVGEVRIALRPSVRLVASEHPILAIWEANQVGRDGTPEGVGGPERVAVRLVETLEPVPTSVGEGEWLLLAAFGRGASLGEAASDCSARGLDFESALARLAGLDVLTGFESAGR